DLLQQHLLAVMRPTLDVGTAIKNFSRFRRKLFCVQKLDVMSGIRFMDCNDRHDRRVEGQEMALLLLRAPIFFQRCPASSRSRSPQPLSFRTVGACPSMQKSPSEHMAASPLCLAECRMES